MLAATYITESMESSTRALDGSDTFELIRPAFVDSPGSMDSSLGGVGWLERPVVEALRPYVEHAQVVRAEEEMRALRYPISIDRLFSRASG
jgi:hypothetical protein